MAKKKNDTLKVPKQIMSFKLSKGTRKDIKKLLKMVSNPDTKTVALSAAGGLAAFLAERFTQHELGKQRRRAAQPH